MRSFLKKVLDNLETKRGARIALLLIFAAGVLTTVLVYDRNVFGPIHFNDEVRYWDIALDFYKGQFSFAKNNDYPPFYSISLLPAFYFFSPFARYAAARWLNAIYVTSAIFPAYLILRKFISRRLSLLAVLVLLCSPIQLVIPRCMISENAFYPLFMWALLLAFTDLSPVESKLHYVEDIAFGVLLALLYATRFIALVMIPALLLIWWLKPVDGESRFLQFSWKKVIHLLVVLIPMAALLAAWLFAGTGDGVPLKQMMGFTVASHPNPAQLGKRRLLMWIIFYLSYTVLLAAPYLGWLLASFSQFKLKHWREDGNRWWISLFIIIFFLLVACVRHSWRAAYNYPEPVKIQGRYIMYFVPLFIITVFIYFRRQSMPRKPVLFGLLTFLLSAALVVFSYAVLFGGFIYMDSTLSPSVNSPYGNLIRTLNIWYVILTLACVLMALLLLNRKREYQIGALALFLMGFYLFGNVRVYDRILTSRQLLNSQIHNLLEVVEPYIPEAEDRAAIMLEIPTQSESRVIRSWSQALNFAGYTENQLNPSAEVDADPTLVFQADYAGHVIQLHQLTAGEYAQAGGFKFTQSGLYYEYEEISTK